MRVGRALGGGLLAIGAAAPVVSSRVLGRAAERLLAAPRTMPDEVALGPVIEALGGEVVRLHARDGTRLAARWLLAGGAGVRQEGASTGVRQDAASTAVGQDAGWAPDPHEAVLLLHGYSGSVAPDIVEYAPFLLNTASVLALDFRGHGGSGAGPTTFGALEIEDVAGALAWLGERGIRRVALFGTSMGGMTAIAATAVLGDGRLVAADHDPASAASAAGAAPAPRPRIVGVVGDAVAPEVAIPVGRRLPGPFGRHLADRLFDAAAARLGVDPRSTEPIRTVPLLEDVPLLLIHGEADRTVPVADGRRLAAAAPEGSRHMVIPGADHSAGHRVAPREYEWQVTAFLREAFAGARGDADRVPILRRDAPPGNDAGQGAREPA